MNPRLKTRTKHATELRVRLSRAKLERLLYVPGDDLGSEAEAAAIAIELLWDELLLAGLTASEQDQSTALVRAIEKVKLAL